MKDKTLYVRNLSRVSFEEGYALQKALHKSEDNYLLFLEHDPVYTCGSGTKDEHLKNVKESGVPIYDVDRGGSITFHGPGQLVGYPIISVGQTRGDLRGSLTFIRTLQELLIESLEILGVPAISKEGYTGVWVDTGEGQPEFSRYKKLAAIGVKVAQGKTIHGFALNVSTDLNAFEKIIPCGIYEYKATSLEELGYEHISQDEIIETITKVFIEKFNFDHVDIASTLNIENTQATISNFSSESFSPAQPSLRLLGRLSKAGVAVDKTKDRRDRPEWMKNKAIQSEGFLELKKLSKDLKLNTVCEEAGCPNIYECWESKTATFMILGERCTRACSFCLVDTRKPFAPDENEPENVATAIAELKLEFAVITCVARDDLYDDGANQFAETVKAIRRKSPNTGIELLISDCKGKDESLKIIFDEKPDVLNHNIETVARLQKAVRPSASYARSLSVLARAKAAGLKTKSGIIVGMGETNGEIYQTLIDLKNVGVDVVTIGQYLQPTPKHLPVHRFVNIKEFNEFADYGHKIGINHVESGPLVRSSYHAKEAAQGTN